MKYDKKSKFCINILDNIYLNLKYYKEVDKILFWDPFENNNFGQASYPSSDT